MLGVRALGVLACCALAAGCVRSTQPGGGAAQRQARCGPAAARTLGVSPEARIYMSRGIVYGCAAATGRSWRLGQDQTCLRAPRVQSGTLSGSVVAYGLQSCGVDSGTATVVVRRLSDGAELVRSPAVAGPVGPESLQRIASLVLRSDGAVAWVGVASSIVRHRVTIEVRKHDTTGEALLDRGAGVQPGSLALRGSSVSWRDGASTRSATLI